MTLIQLFILINLILVIILIIRGLLTKNLGFYGFMVWNIFLALVPLFLATKFEYIYENYGYVVVLVVFIVWLLFLPNAYYLLTDLMHLNQKVLVNKRGDKFKPSIEFERGDPLYLLDSSILYLVSSIGLISGGVSMYLFNEFIDSNINTMQVVLIIFVLVSSAIGIYLGRYSRWNSWDAMIKPHKVVIDFIKSFKSKKERKRILIVTILFIVIETLSWQVAKVFFDSIA